VDEHHEAKRPRWHPKIAVEGGIADGNLNGDDLLLG
jgi:hypothetical protein